MPASGGQPSIPELRRFTRIISAAELLAFTGGAIPVVPPAGISQLVSVVSGQILYNFGTEDFSSSADIDVRYSGTHISAVITGLFQLQGQGVSQVQLTTGSINNNAVAPVASIVGVGLDLVLTSGSFTADGVRSATIGAPGSGYAVGDTGTLTTGGGDATYRITSVGALGVVTGFVITTPGNGYSTGNGQATATGGAQPGVGINFTVNVNSLTIGDGTFKVTTLYQVIDVP